MDRPGATLLVERGQGGGGGANGAKTEPEVRPASRRDEPRARSRVKETGRSGGSGFVGLLLRDQAAYPLGEQGSVERLLEGIIEAEGVELLARLVAREGDENRRDVILALAQVLSDLPRFDPADGQVDDDAVGVETLGPDARLE